MRAVGTRGGRAAQQTEQQARLDDLMAEDGRRERVDLVRVRVRVRVRVKVRVRARARFRVRVVFGFRVRVGVGVGVGVGLGLGLGGFGFGESELTSRWKRCASAAMLRMPG